MEKTSKVYGQKHYKDDISDKRHMHASSVYEIGGKNGRPPDCK